VTDVAAPAATPAPEAVPNGGRPTFNHPAIPAPRNLPPKASVAAAPVEAPPAAPKAEVPPLEAKAEPEAELPDVEEVEYRPDDEFDVVINGKPGTVTLSKLIASYQRNEAANASFLEAKNMRAAAETIVRNMFTPNGFIQTCKEAGADPYQIAEDIVLERYNYERMTPEQKRMHDFERERGAWEAQRQAEAERAEAQRTEQQAAAFQARFLDESSATMDRLRVPADPELRNEIIGRAAQFYRADIQAGYSGVSIRESVESAWSSYQERLSKHARALPVETRISDEERAAMAAKGAQDRVRVAHAAPKPAIQPRGDDGKFVPAHTKPKFDMFNPSGFTKR
jgi:hypothetical protein